ncbi:MAG TPA: hypothetical protein PK458_06870 [Phycisphaerae bacterium]|nr:hypothetical protein [Phycisphaerae bacterium]HPU25887.1 hypothetical protein [Phycisphaerae bacterium]
MSDMPLRNRGPLQTTLFTAVAACVLGGVLLIAGLILLFVPEARLGGVVALGAGLLLVSLSLILNAIMVVTAKTEANVNRIHNVLLEMQEVVQRMAPLVKIVADNSQISDAVRSITHRESEREALRQAIREEMYSGDWEAATYLVNEMERRFGYKQEAETLRQELAAAREMTIEEKINQALTHIEKILSEHRWERARAEIDRLVKLFPRHERVLNLPKELERRREAQKQALLARWNEAVARNEIDQGIEILTELDQYLTREEAQNLQDSARGVFKARLLNLGVQFGLAVSENRWRDALEIGLQIRQEFPNSRMAQEVSERIDILRIRAGFKTEAEITMRQAATSSS